MKTEKQYIFTREELIQLACAKAGILSKDVASKLSSKGLVLEEL